MSRPSYPSYPEDEVQHTAARYAEGTYAPVTHISRADRDFSRKYQFDPKEINAPYMNVERTSGTSFKPPSTGKKIIKDIPRSAANASITTQSITTAVGSAVGYLTNNITSPVRYLGSMFQSRSEKPKVESSPKLTSVLTKGTANAKPKLTLTKNGPAFVLPEEQAINLQVDKDIKDASDTNVKSPKEVPEPKQYVDVKPSGDSAKWRIMNLNKAAKKDKRAVSRDRSTSRGRSPKRGMSGSKLNQKWAKRSVSRERTSTHTLSSKTRARKDSPSPTRIATTKPSPGILIDASNKSSFRIQSSDKEKINGRNKRSKNNAKPLQFFSPTSKPDPHACTEVNKFGIQRPKPMRITSDDLAETLDNTSYKPSQKQKPYNVRKPAKELNRSNSAASQISPALTVKRDLPMQLSDHLDQEIMQTTSKPKQQFVLETRSLEMKPPRLDDMDTRTTETETIPPKDSVRSASPMERIVGFFSMIGRKDTNTESEKGVLQTIPEAQIQNTPNNDAQNNTTKTSITPVKNARNSKRTPSEPVTSLSEKRLSKSPRRSTSKNRMTRSTTRRGLSPYRDTVGGRVGDQSMSRKQTNTKVNETEQRSSSDRKKELTPQREVVKEKHAQPEDVTPNLSKSSTTIKTKEVHEKEKVRPKRPVSPARNYRSQFDGPDDDAMPKTARGVKKHPISPTKNLRYRSQYNAPDEDAMPVTARGSTKPNKPPPNSRVRDHQIQIGDNQQRLKTPVKSSEQPLKDYEQWPEVSGKSGKKILQPNTGYQQRYETPANSFQDQPRKGFEQWSGAPGKSIHGQPNTGYQQRSETPENTFQGQPHNGYQQWSQTQGKAIHGQTNTGYQQRPETPENSFQGQPYNAYKQRSETPGKSILQPNTGYQQRSQSPAKTFQEQSRNCYQQWSETPGKSSSQLSQHSFTDQQHSGNKRYIAPDQSLSEQPRTGYQQWSQAPQQSYSEQQHKGHQQWTQAPQQSVPQQPGNVQQWSIAHDDSFSESTRTNNMNTPGSFFEPPRKGYKSPTNYVQQFPGTPQYKSSGPEEHEIKSKVHRVQQDQDQLIRVPLVTVNNDESIHDRAPVLVNTDSRAPKRFEIVHNPEMDCDCGQVDERPYAFGFKPDIGQNSPPMEARTFQPFSGVQQRSPPMDTQTFGLSSNINKLLSKGPAVTVAHEPPILLPSQPASTPLNTTCGVSPISANMSNVHLYGQSNPLEQVFPGRKPEFEVRACSSSHIQDGPDQMSKKRIQIPQNNPPKKAQCPKKNQNNNDEFCSTHVDAFTMQGELP